MIRYRVTVRRRGHIVSLRFEWASPIRERAIEALTREAKKRYGDDCSVEVFED